MAFGTNYRTLPGVVAGADLSAKQFYAVKLSTTTAGTVIINNTSLFAGNYVGILQNAPASGEEAEVAIDGICKMIVKDTTIIVGDGIGLNSTGKGTDASTTDNAARIAKALQASAADGDIIAVHLYGAGGVRY